MTWTFDQSEIRAVKAAARDVRSRCPPASRARGRRRKRDRLDVESAAGDQPRDREFEFHLPCTQLVPSPDGRRRQWHQLEESPGGLGVLGDAARACDRFGEVGDDAVAPASHLVAEETEPPGGACPGGPLGDDAALGAAAPRRRLLDDERAFEEENPKGR